MKNFQTKTKEQRREIYWEAYAAAIGMHTIHGNTYKWGELPRGLCELIEDDITNYSVDMDDLPELKELRPINWLYSDALYWFEEGAWVPRSKVLLEAIEKTYE